MRLACPRPRPASRMQAAQPHPGGAAHHAAADGHWAGRGCAARGSLLAADPPVGFWLPGRGVCGLLEHLLIAGAAGGLGGRSQEGRAGGEQSRHVRGAGEAATCQLGVRAGPHAMPRWPTCLQVWGRPSREALRGWRTFAGLAYASAGGLERSDATDAAMQSLERLPSILCHCPSGSDSPLSLPPNTTRSHEMH